jgi:hypothetical protein
MVPHAPPKVVLSDQPILTPSVGQINGRAESTPSSSEVRGGASGEPELRARGATSLSAH